MVVELQDSVLTGEDLLYKIKIIKGAVLRAALGRACLVQVSISVRTVTEPEQVDPDRQYLMEPVRVVALPDTGNKRS